MSWQQLRSGTIYLQERGTSMKGLGLQMGMRASAELPRRFPRRFRPVRVKLHG